jgi:hypothetical protein
VFFEGGADIAEPGESRGGGRNLAVDAELAAVDGHAVLLAPGGGGIDLGLDLCGVPALAPVVLGDAARLLAGDLLHHRGDGLRRRRVGQVAQAGPGLEAPGGALMGEVVGRVEVEGVEDVAIRDGLEARQALDVRPLVAGGDDGVSRRGRADEFDEARLGRGPQPRFLDARRLVADFEENELGIGGREARGDGAPEGLELVGSSGRGIGPGPVCVGGVNIENDSEAGTRQHADRVLKLLPVLLPNLARRGVPQVIGVHGQAHVRQAAGADEVGIGSGDVRADVAMGSVGRVHEPVREVDAASEAGESLRRNAIVGGAGPEHGAGQCGEQQDEHVHRRHLKPFFHVALKRAVARGRATRSGDGIRDMYA